MLREYLAENSEFTTDDSLPESSERLIGVRLGIMNAVEIPPDLGVHQNELPEILSTHLD